MGVVNNIDTILGIAIGIMTLFAFFQNRMTASERRLTILEEENKQTAKLLGEYSERLKEHDKQNDVLIKLTQQLTNLNEKVEKIDKRLDEVK